MQHVTLSTLVALAACTSSKLPFVVTTPEPPSEECPFGAQRRLEGDDDDDSGTLEDSEIERNVLICNKEKVFHGDLVIRTTEEARALDQINRITGSLTIAADIGLLEVPFLLRVKGALVIEGGGEFVAGALRAVGGSVTTGARRFVAPRLTKIGGSLVVSHDIDVPRLRSIGGDLVIVGTPFGIELALPSLGDVRGIIFTDGLRGTGIVFNAPRLVRVDFIRAVPRMPLAEHGPIGIRSIFMPALVIIDTELDFTFTQLTSLYVPALQRVPFIRLVDNPLLCESEALALARRTGAAFEIADNASCAN